MRLRNKLLERPDGRASSCFSPRGALSYLEVAIGPPYPRRPVCSRDEVLEFLQQTPYQGGRFFPFETIRRIEDGAAGRDPGNRAYGEVSKYGLIVSRSGIGGAGSDKLPFADLFQPLRKILVCASRFFARVQYRGNLDIKIVLGNVDRKLMQLVDPSTPFPPELEDFRCYDMVVTARQTVASENLETGLAGVLKDILNQLCWSFWQSHHAFPSERFSQSVERYLQGVGL